MATTIPDGLPADLRQKFASIRKAQSVTKFVTVILVLVVIAEFAWFTFATVEPVKAGFKDSSRVQKAVQDAVPEVQPVVVDTLQKVVQEVAPIYREQATKKYESIRANLGKKVNERFTALPDQAEKVLGDQLRSTFDRVLKNLEPELKAAFPTLSDDKRQDLVVNHFHEAIAAKNEALSAKIDAIRTSETVKVKNLLDSFALPPDSAMARDGEIERELERVLLMLANEQIQQRLNSPELAPAKK